MGTSVGLYRPPQWQQGLSITTVMLIFPGQPTQGQYSAQGISATLPKSQTRYIFDAVLRASHSQRIQKTAHPVQTGANIVDHAYVVPAELVLEIAMSDAMADYSKDMWTGAATKSISTYQVILAMSIARIPLSIATRLRTYTNMLITDIEADDTVKTIGGLKMRVTFSEIPLAITQTNDDSARPQTTSTTTLGSVIPTPPTATQDANYNVLGNTSQNSSPPVLYDAPGTSDWSSTQVTASA